MIEEFRINAGLMGRIALAAVCAVAMLADTTGTVSPVVTWIQPANNSTFAAGASVVLQVSATDTGGSISQVLFMNASGGKILGSASSAPYQVTLGGLAS